MELSSWIITFGATEDVKRKMSSSVCAEATELPTSRPSSPTNPKIRGPIHLLLTDVVMPRMSGHDLTRCQTPSRPDTRILYMSGYAGSTHLLQDAQDIGVTFISKPFTPDALARQVRQVLDAP